mgnify:CR=1 FL=1
MGTAMNRPRIDRRRFSRDPAREWKPVAYWREGIAVAAVLALLWANGLGAF